MSRSDYVHVEVVKIASETDKAFLIQLNNPEDPHRKVWVPKSQVADAADYQEGDEHCTLSISKWWVEKNPDRGINPD